MQIIDITQRHQVVPPKKVCSNKKTADKLSKTMYPYESKNSMNNPSALSWLYLTRSQCVEKLKQQNLDHTDFARWLAIPSLNEILVFKHGICCRIEQGLLR